MATTYTTWNKGDKINICVSMDDFCGTTEKFIYIYDINVTKSPNICTVIFGTEGGCGLHLNNIELTFKLVKATGSTQGKTCEPEIVYKTLGTSKTDSNGTCGISYTVTEQDRLDYESQIVDDVYKVMACITNSDFQNVKSSMISKVTDTITILPSQINDPCYGVTCPDTCIGTDLWSQTCIITSPTTYKCTPNIIKETNNIVCDEYTLYYKVPWIYPTWYVNSILPYVQSLGNNALSSYPDYYVASRTYNETNKILEVLIKRKQLPTLQSLVGFVPIALVIVALELLAGIAIFLYGIQYLSTKKGKGVAPTNRSVKITPGLCTPTCIAMSVPVIIEYNI